MMISYAQNMEDVILARAFDPGYKGFYIDVGVWHPTLHSVTKHFYDAGWTGINVEPVAENFERIRAGRPRDINVHAAVDRTPGSIAIHHVRDTGLSTVSKNYARKHSAAGFDVETVTVPALTLADLCRTHAAGRAIDFLKIDVEGAEAAVVEGGDWTAFRPKIVVVEATEPNSPKPSFVDWEPFLLAQDYLFCYFDGLNRWYVSREELHLQKHFNAPPNPFDEYTLARIVELEQANLALSRALESTRLDQSQIAMATSSRLGRALFAAIGLVTPRRMVRPDAHKSA